jgi:hypothetical protein
VSLKVSITAVSTMSFMLQGKNVHDTLCMQLRPVMRNVSDCQLQRRPIIHLTLLVYGVVAGIDDPAIQVKDCINRMLSNKRASTVDQYKRQSAASSHTTIDKTVALSKRGFDICQEQYNKSLAYYCSLLLTHDGQE